MPTRRVSQKSRKSRRTPRKSRRTPRKSRQTPRKSRQTPRKSRQTPRKSLLRRISSRVANYPKTMAVALMGTAHMGYCMSHSTSSACPHHHGCTVQRGYCVSDYTTLAKKSQGALNKIQKIVKNFMRGGARSTGVAVHRRPQRRRSASRITMRRTPNSKRLM